MTSEKRDSCVNVCVLLAFSLALPECGRADDCNGNSVSDESEVTALYAGTQGGIGGGGARVLRYAGGTSWVVLTPSGWNVSAVMDLAFFDGYLYAGVQTLPGYGGSGDTGSGQVWRYDGSGWEQVGSLDRSVMVLEVMANDLMVDQLYAGTSDGFDDAGRLYRCTTCDGVDWEEPIENGVWGTGFRAGIVSSICGTNGLYLGDLNTDSFFRFVLGASGLDTDEKTGSCIWDFAELGSALYAGAWSHLGQQSGPVYHMLPESCGATHPWGVALTTDQQNWALESFRTLLYIGTGGDNGGQLLTWRVQDSTLTLVRSWSSPVANSGVSALAAQGDDLLFIGMGLPDGYTYTVPGQTTDPRAEVWRFDGASFHRVSPPDTPSAENPFGGGVQTLLLKPGAFPDCDFNWVPDACDVAALDCNGNGVVDSCEPECNNNGIPDDCDIAASTSDDCNQDGIPDECQTDCNHNGIPDDCDISNCQPGVLWCQDCNVDGVPNACDPDCDGSGVSDICEVRSGARPDCNANGIPDGCDISSCQPWVLGCQDCDGNAIPDECDLRDCAPDDLACADCNANGVQDGCDIDQWTSYDLNGNGLPDECEDCNGNWMPDECEFTCEGGCGAIYNCHDPMYKECNSNGVPDACDPDCNNNGIPDDCDRCGLFLGDRDRDCDTDLWDFAFFQDCYETPGASVTGECACVADMDTNGVLDLTDYVAFEAQLGGPTVGGQMMMMGGEGGESMMMGFDTGGEAMMAVEAPLAEEVAGPVEPEPDPWTYASADLSFELRPVGGGEAVTTLAPHTTYEVYYAAATEHVGFYLLIAVAQSTAQGLTGAAPPTAGDWSGAAHFLFRNAAAEAGAPVPAPEYGEGWYRTHSVNDDFFPAADTAGSAGVLCTITTGEPGELALELYMDWADPDTFHLVTMAAQVQVAVEAP